MRTKLPDLPSRGLACGAVLLVLGACGGEADTEAGSRQSATDDFCGPALAAVEAYQAEVAVDPVMPGPAERYGGTLVVGDLGELGDGMNGFVSQNDAAAQHQGFVNLMTLLLFDGDLQPQPYLAESWEVSEDGRTLTFTLRDDVYWHDGEITDAEDIVFTFETAKNPETGYPNPAYLDPYTSVEAIDARTVRFTLEPHAEYLVALGALIIMPEHLLGDVPPPKLRQHPFGSQCPVGNGPFVFSSHRPQESWTFTANPAFPAELGGRPYVDRYVYRAIPEQTTLLTDLFTGSVDINMALRADQAAQVLAESDVELETYTRRAYDFVGWNARRAKLEDPMVRRAITLGTNRREIVDALLAGYGEVANSSVPPYHWAYDPSLTDMYAYDPEAARRLLDEAGWVDRDGDGVRENAEGVPLSLEVKFNEGNQTRQDVGEIMQAQLTRIGVDLQPTVVEFNTLVGQITGEARDFDGVILGWTPGYKLDDRDIFHSERIDGPYAFSGTENPEVDRYIDTLQTILDRDDARPVWLEYQRVLAEEQPYTFLYFPPGLAAYRNRVNGVDMDVSGEWAGIRGWWIEPSERRQR